MNTLTATPLEVTDADIDGLLNSGAGVVLLLSNGEGLRSDARTEFDKAAAEHNERLRFARVDTRYAPATAARFEVEKNPVLITWVNGDVLARRGKPWGTDIKGMVEELLKVAPASEPKQEIIKVIKTPITVTEATFDELVVNSDLPVVVDFWAAWCGPCKKVAPVLDKLAGEYAGRLVIAKVNTDENRALSQYFRIESIPTLMLVKDHKIVGQSAGAYPEATMRQMFDRLLTL